MTKPSSNLVNGLKKSARKGDADAQYSLGVLYENGEGLAQNQATALWWYRKAANRGNSVAQCRLGVAYDEGQGVGQDHKVAVKWYRKAADQGNADAQYNLGVAHEDGEGVAQDYVAAAKWYEKSARKGDADAQYSLGVLYENGEGLAQNQAEAVKWYRRAADQGQQSAKQRLKTVEQTGQDEEQDELEDTDHAGESTLDADSNRNTRDAHASISSEEHLEPQEMLRQSLLSSKVIVPQTAKQGEKSDPNKKPEHKQPDEAPESETTRNRGVTQIGSGSTIKERLAAVEELRDMRLITEEEAAEKRLQILNDL